MKKLKLAQFGLGPIGLETLKLAATRPWAKIVGAIDIAPEKVGQDLGALTGNPTLSGRKVYPSLDALLGSAGRPDLVLHTAVSKFKVAYLQLEPIVRQGIDIVSSCEELIFPRLREPALAARMERLCRKHSARIVATGVNPGFVMDLLPIFLTGVSREVKAIHIQRVVNASTRRGPLQKKIGSGQDPAKFNRLLKAGQAGHAGLNESLALVAHCLGWPFNVIRGSSRPVIAEHDIQTAHFRVKKGQVCGIHQYAEARAKAKAFLTLDIKMYLGAKDPHDAVQIEGEPPLDVRINGGVAGDQATVAALVNTAARISKAAPGLLLLSDLPVPVWA